MSPMNRLVTATAVMGALLSAAAAGAEKLPVAQRFRQLATEHLEKAQAGGDATAEIRRAVNYLKAALRILDRYDEPRPPEVEQEVQSINSMLYWAKKMTPVTEADAHKEDGAEVEVTAAIEEMAKEFYRRAEQYAAAHPDDHFLIAIRFFEVADRFRGTKLSLKAQGLSLKHQQLSLTPPAARAEAKPVPRADASGARTAPPVDANEAVAELAGQLESAGSKQQHLALIDEQLARLRGTPDERVLEDLRNIYTASNEIARVAMADAFLATHPKTPFGRIVDRVRTRARSFRDFGALKATLHSNASVQRKAGACAKFVREYPNATEKAEAEALRAAFAARSADERALAWAGYLSSFPSGILASQAQKELERSEGVVVGGVAKALQAGDAQRAQKLGKVYLDLFQQGTSRTEIRSLLAALGAANPAERLKGIAAHRARYKFSVFERPLQELVRQWKDERARSAFEKLVKDLETAKSDADRGSLLSAYLLSNPRGANAAEVRALRDAYRLRSSRARAAAARKFGRVYAGGRFAGYARELEQAALTEVENEAFRLAAESANDDTRGLGARLAACETYLGEFPDGANAPVVRELESGLREMIAGEAAAFAKLSAKIKSVASPEAGIGLCEAHLRAYQGGAHQQSVLEWKRGFDRRMAELDEARAYGQLREKLEGTTLDAIAKADACLAFLDAHPAGKHRGDVTAAVKKHRSLSLPIDFGAVEWACFSDSSDALLVVQHHEGRNETIVSLFAVPGLHVKQRFRLGPAARVSSATLSHDGSVAYVGDASGGLTVIDVTSPAVEGRFRLGRGEVVAVIAAADGTVVSASRGEKLLRSWNAGSWTVDESVRCGGAVAACAADSRGAAYAVADTGGGLALVAFGDEAPRWSKAGAHTGAVDAVAMSPHGRYVATTSVADNSAKVWNAQDGSELWRDDGAGGSVAFCGERYVVTTRAIHAARSGDRILELRGADRVAGSPDGRFVFASGDDGTGTVWYMPAVTAR